MEHNANGVKAEERNLLREGPSYLHNFGSYIHRISAYLPNSVKKQLASNPSSSLEERDPILWTSFDKLERDGKKIDVLNIAYANGFQIWDVENGDNVQEILSKREGPIKFLKILPTSSKPETAQHPLFDKRPIVAVVSAADASSTFPNTQVKLYSLKTNEHLSVLRFRTEVFSVLCSDKILLVVLRDHIYAFDAVTMKTVVTLNCFASPMPYCGAAALGPRWIAYPGNQPVHTNRTQSASDKFVEVAKDVAKDFAASIYQLGQKTIAEYMYPNDPPQVSSAPKSVNQEAEQAAGTVVIYDVVSQETVVHFQAHQHSLSALAFDPSGTLLVTSSIGGHNFHVFQITPKMAGVHQNYRHMYTLQRGLTNAIIQHISFSDDSRWIAVSSQRTTHIFAINPVGGLVNVHTHLKSVGLPKSPESAIIGLDLNTQSITLPAFYRIKHSTLEDFFKVQVQSNIVSATSTFAGDKILTVTQVGLLTKHQMKPHAPPGDSEVDPTSLLLAAEPLIEWDVCRKTKWVEVMPTFSAEKNVEVARVESPGQMNWLGNVEINTHNPYLRPVWTSPQFTFKMYQTHEEKIRKSKENEDGALPYCFYENTPTRKIDVQRTDPGSYGELRHNYPQDLYSSQGL
eukprot:TRINITY_DN3834_c0_g1_i3.p1 TRINITY_DN3834_c0_g1~~TRINITY_DN3834_c0_g1_i3.p1  ORF type:complete len:627 (-),score=105.11 TRINITY_DN3834_c0_g1_i3:115-1995(-)